MTLLRKVLPLLCFALIFPISAPVEGSSAPGSFLPTTSNVPLAGDLNRSVAGDELAYFNSDLRAFYLCKERFAELTLACIEYRLPIFGQGVPLLGRWSHSDDVDRPALYDPVNGRLWIFQYADCLPDECEVSGTLELAAMYDLTITDAIPVVGDWDGSDVDTVALVRPRPKEGPSLRSQVNFFDDGFRTSTTSDLWGLDLNGYTVVAGDWPGNQHVGDSLGFYDEVTHDVLLLDGLASVRMVTVPTDHEGLKAFGFDDPEGAGIGLYYPPICSGSMGCHRVGLWDIPFIGLFASAVHPPNPLLDSRFPNDPGDPPPPGF